MAFNLIELTGSVLTSSVIKKLAEHIGEKPANTQTAVDALIPSLAGIACNQASTPSGAENLLNLIAPNRLNTDFLNNFGNVFDKSASIDTLLKNGAGLTSSLLGNRTSSIARMIAGVAGVRESSASSLLNLVSPVVLGLLGREAASRTTSASDLSSLLAANSDAIRKLAPAGLAGAMGVSSVADLLGTSGAKAVGAYPQSQAPSPSPRVGAYEQSSTPRVGAYEHPQATPPRVGAYDKPQAPPPPPPPPLITRQEPKRGANWLLWLIPFAALLIGIPFYRGCSTPTQANYASVALPCGTTLRVIEGSFNHTLATFMLRGADSEMPKRIVFDNLNFDSGVTRLTPESNQTVTDLSSIMKCFPKMQVKLEGHTDNTGEVAANRKLSVDRAETVKALLVQDGIDSSRIATEGFGQDQPVASNDTDEGRAKNRLTELEVIAK